MKMKMIVKKKKMLLVFMVLLLSAGAMQAQVRIGQNEAPRNGAILDLSNESGGYKGGLLLPKINIDDLGKIPQSFSNGPATRQDTLDLAGLIVWNTRSGFEGVYMWDGKDWKRMAGETPLSYPNCSPLPVGLLASLYGTRDADGNLRIDIPSGLDARGAISPFKLTVTSDPLGSLTAVADTYNNGGVVFNPAQAWTNGQLQASPTVYDNLQAADMSSGTGAVTAADPWKTRQTVLTFSGESGCPPVTDTRTVTLNQTNYAIKPSVSQITFNNINPNNFTIDANVAWKVKSIDDPAGILQTNTMTISTTGGADRSDNDKTTSISYSVTGVDKPNTLYQTATITLEDTNNPKRAKDVQIGCVQCMGTPNLSYITKVAEPDETAAGDTRWNTGATKAEKVVRHKAKPNPNYVQGSDPDYMENIYEEFLSADFGPAGRWMITNLAAFMYDPKRTSADITPCSLPTTPATTWNVVNWSFPSASGASTSNTFYNDHKVYGLMYSRRAVLQGKMNGEIRNPGVTDICESYCDYGSGPDEIQQFQGLCPAGWHTPSSLEYVKLIKEIIRNTSLYAYAPDINPLESIDGALPTDILKRQPAHSSTNNQISDSQINVLPIDACFGGQARSIYDGAPAFLRNGNSAGSHGQLAEYWCGSMISNTHLNTFRNNVSTMGVPSSQKDGWGFNLRCVKD